MENNFEKIVFVLPGKKSGGTNVCLEVFKALLKVDKDISLYTLKRGFFGVFGELLKLCLYFFWSRLTKTDGIYVITDPLQCIIASFSGVRYVRYLQADDISLFNNRLYPFGKIISLIQKIFSYRDTGFLYVSNYAKKKYLASKFGVKSNASFKVNPLVDSVFLSRIIEGEQQFRCKSNQKFVVGYMARKSPGKGFNEFCFWVNECPSDIKDRIDNILIISDEVSYSEINSKLNHSFSLVNPSGYKDVAIYLKRVDVFVFNSTNEGFGLPPLEALLSGAQVVCSKCGGVEEYLNASNSFLFEVSNQKNFYNEISKPIIEDVVLNVDRGFLADEFSKYDHEFLVDLLCFIRKEGIEFNV